MIWFLTALFYIIMIEFVVRIPFPGIIKDASVVAQKALHILRAKSVSDHWKEKVMLVYAGKLFVSTMKLAGSLVLIGIFAMLLILAADYFGAKIGDFVFTWAGIFYSIIVATIYLKIRKKLFV